MFEGHTVVDVDAHYPESLGDLAAYLDEGDPWRERFEEAPSKLLPNTTPDHYRYGRIQRDESGYLDGTMGPDDIPGIMDHLGLDQTVLLPNKALSFGRMRGDDKRPVVLMNTFVDFMLDRVVDPAAGIHTMIPVPHNDVDAAVDLIDRVSGEPGIVGICMVCAAGDPPFGNRRYDPIYEATQDAGLPLVFHGGGASLDHFHRKGYSEFIESHSLGFIETNMEQLTSIVVQGVPVKYPDLDIMFQESGVLWVASFMYRLDQEYLKRQSEAPLLEKLPSEYVKDFYFGTQPLERPPDMDYLRNAIETVGVGQFMYTTDYPHWDYDPPSAITDLPFLSEEQRAMVLGGTAEAVFGI